MQPRIIVVAFDKNDNDPGAVAYSKLSVPQKIIHMREHITQICEQLKTIDPKALWLLGWAEYGITTGLTKGALSPAEKRYFKQTMQMLACTYPQLAIIAGTVHTYRNFTDPKKIDLINNYYALHPRVALKEKADVPAKHYMEQEKEKIKTVKVPLHQTGVNVVRNSCFVFYGKNIWCHDKSAPVHECTNNKTRLNNSIFQPAKAKNMNPLCSLEHPVTGDTITLGIEICNEHYHSVLKYADVHKQTLIHLILSDSIRLHPKKFSGKYVIQLDTETKPKLIVTSKEKCPSVSIQFYQTNLFKADDRLHGPLQPLHPFPKRVLEKVEALTALLPNDDRKSAFLTLSTNLYKMLDKYFDKAAAMYDYIYMLIDINKHFFKNKYLTTSQGLVLVGPDLLKFREELVQMIENEKAVNPEFVDIHSRNNAPLI